MLGRGQYFWLFLLYDVDVRTINEHIKKIYSDSELEEDSTIRNFRIVQTEGDVYKRQEQGFIKGELPYSHRCGEGKFDSTRVNTRTDCLYTVSYTHLEQFEYMYRLFFFVFRALKR